MKIYGIDFTSAPRPGKSITCAECTLENGLLHLNDLKYLETFVKFDDFLKNGTEWIAGMDFPFGQPKKLIKYWKLLLSWKEYVGVIEKWGKEKFEAKLNEYREQSPKGEKHLKRETDRIAKSISPMNIIRPPVGKMFFEGARRLLNSGVSILPCHKNGSQMIVVEAYPKLVATKLISTQKYKDDNKNKETSQQIEARKKIVTKLKSGCIKSCYGFDVVLKEDFAAKMIDDHTGDYLDAFLCAIQAGWAYGQRETGYGIPKGFELEGWIVDPDLYIISNSEKRLERR